jgi:hypothetical protein
MIDEREKMKIRIHKLKNRKGKIDYGIKMCRNCGKEFPEKENFNWSCRTHQYDYNGEMWWCCGKKGKDQPGCRWSKHETKEDDEEDDDDGEKEKRSQQISLIRCQCCKELGHLIDDCPRDPNYKTKGQVEDEGERLKKLKDYRKLFADTVVMTTHMLKKCVKVPKLTMQTPMEPNGIPVTEYNRIIERQKVEPFKRGVMSFDDYNYDLYNQYILVDPNFNENDDNPPLPKGFKPKMVQKTKKG